MADKLETSASSATCNLFVLFIALSSASSTTPFGTFHDVFGRWFRAQATLLQRLQAWDASASDKEKERTTQHNKPLITAALRAEKQRSLAGAATSLTDHQCRAFRDLQDTYIVEVARHVHSIVWKKVRTLLQQSSAVAELRWQDHGQHLRHHPSLRLLRDTRVGDNFSGDFSGAFSSDTVDHSDGRSSI